MEGEEIKDDENLKAAEASRKPLETKYSPNEVSNDPFYVDGQEGFEVKTDKIEVEAEL